MTNNNTVITREISIESQRDAEAVMGTMDQSDIRGWLPTFHVSVARSAPLQPVIDSQAVHPFEFASVMGHKRHAHA
jgi:hypothetical protein